MDNESGEGAPVGRRIALGLSDYLDDFAARQDALTWKLFARKSPL
jgi:hypothetical protein